VNREHFQPIEVNDLRLILFVYEINAIYFSCSSASILLECAERAPNQNQVNICFIRIFAKQQVFHLPLPLKLSNKSDLLD